MKRIHAYWKRHPKYSGELAICSNCGESSIISDGRSWDYPDVCEHCHAIMDLPKEEPPTPAKLNKHPMVIDWAKGRKL